MSVFDGVLDLVGATPLVRLRRLYDGAGPEVYAKLESTNPAGSAKDRTAKAMLDAALSDGSLHPGDTVVESSSGNLGVALAQACGWYDLRFVCVVDPNANTATLREIEAYGGTLHPVTAPDPVTGDWLSARRHAVRGLLRTLPRAWCPDQYANLTNPAAHAAGTMREIVADLGGPPDAVFVATSTTGTLRGCQDHLRSIGADTEVVAVDAVGSVLFGGIARPRLLPGFGAGVVPPLAEGIAPDRVLRVDDLDCVVGCRRTVASERILIGASDGGVVTALGRELDAYGPQDRVVMIFHDGGARYLDTVYDDAWVAGELGCDPELLAEHVRAA